MISNGISEVNSKSRWYRNVDKILVQLSLTHCPRPLISIAPTHPTPFHRVPTPSSHSHTPPPRSEPAARCLPWRSSVQLPRVPTQPYAAPCCCRWHRRRLRVFGLHLTSERGRPLFCYKSLNRPSRHRRLQSRLKSC